LDGPFAGLFKAASSPSPAALLSFDASVDSIAALAL
jgi:hypothetical protein